MIVISWIKRFSVGMAVLSAPAFVMAQSVEAFTLTSEPFNNSVNGVVPCYVDESGPAMNQLTAAVQANSAPDTGGQVNQQDFQALSDSIICSYQAALMGVQKVPAVVVDHKYVVYGNTDMTGAVAEIQNAQSNS